jgi:hypothetical protein
MVPVEKASIGRSEELVDAHMLWGGWGEVVVRTQATKAR